MADVRIKIKGESELRTIFGGVRAVEDLPAQKLVVYDALDIVIAKINLHDVDSFWPEAPSEPVAWSSF